MARPTKYNEKILEKAQRYLDKCIEENEIPYIEELALICNVDDDTIVRWSNKKEVVLVDEKEKTVRCYPEFYAAYKKLKTLQKLQLLRDSTKRDKFTPGQLFQLKANHGMIEAEKVIHSSDKESPMEGLIVIKHAD